jgi:hypothetical protein
MFRVSHRHEVIVMQQARGCAGPGPTNVMSPEERASASPPDAAAIITPSGW